MKKIFACLAVVCALNAYSQTIFFQDNFENATTPDLPAGSTRTPTSNGGTTTSYFKRSVNTAADISLAPLFGVNYAGMNGAFIWAGEDHDTPTGNGLQQIEWTNINIVGRTNIQFKGCLAANNTNGAWDNVNTGSTMLAFGNAANTATLGNDYIIIEYAIDAGPYTRLISFWGDDIPAGAPPTSNKSLNEDTNGDFIGDGAELNNTLTQYARAIPGTGTTMKLRISVYSNGGNEEWAMDDFRLEETVACTNPTVTLQPGNTSVCVNSNTTFAIAASGATTYQWQVNTGSGFVNVTNTPPYSGATTPTLTITGATLAMNGYTYRCIASQASCSTTSSIATLTVSSPILLPNSQLNVSCFGGSNGSATVSPASGGIAPYSYNWTPGNPTGDGTISVTGLTAGSWTCTVTDNIGCTTTATFNITSPTALSLNALSQTNVSCFGGTNGAASVSAASGGAGGYTYNWTPGNPTGDGTVSVNGLSAGTWTCTVTDANSCTATRTFNITSPSAISVTEASHTNIICFGGNNGAASVNVTGGAGGYSYNWTPGNPTGDGTASVTGLTSGSWTCTVTDANGCIGSTTIVVLQPSAPLTLSATTVNVTCFGASTGSVNLSESGGTPTYTYNWSNGATSQDISGLTAGVYSVTVSDANGCTATLTATITQPTQILSGPASQTNVSCNGGANGAASITTPTGGAGGYTYNWTPGNPTGDGTVSVTGLTAGSWSCTITDANGCTRIQTFNITQPAAIAVSAASQTNVSCNGGSNGAASINTPTGGAGGFTYNWTPGNPTGDGTVSVTGLTAGTWTCTVTDANGCTAAQTFNITAPSAIVVTAASQTNISCNGGSNGAASVNTPTGGAGGYTYNWTPGNPTGDGTVAVTGLTAGSWTCTVTDANTCTATQTFNITAPSAIVVTAATQTNLSCNGGANGAATINTPTGGAGGFTYNWTPGNPTGDGTVSVTGLTAGTWTCTVTDANSCTATQTFNITQPSAITASIASTPTSCTANTGTATVSSVTGGTPTYTYSWTPSGGTGTTASNLAAGTYTCTITDANGCSITRTVTVTTTSGPALTAASQSNISCFAGSNGAATVNAATGGTSPYTYNWTPGNPTGDGTVAVTGLTAGTWTCTVTDANGCGASVTFAITAPAPLIVTPSSISNVSCNGGSNGATSVSVSGGTIAYSYNWTPGNPTGDGTAAVSGLTAGSWTCTVTDANGCTASQSVNITAPTALVASPVSQTNVSCFNGTNGTASVSVTGGTSVYSYNWTPGNPNGDGTASVTGLTAGTWTCTVTDANACTTTVTFNITAPAQLIATASPTNVTCNGAGNGIITAAASGGTAAYSYAWSPVGGNAATTTGLTIGCYTVIVTDANGCTTTASACITEPPALAATATQTNVTCNGGSNGSAAVSVSGGTSAYTYVWSPAGGTGASASGLGANTYSCVITDANGCSITQTVSITEPPALTATAMQTNVSCNGGSNGDAMVMVSGGSGAYTYAWSPAGGTNASATGLTAGTYTCLITDANGCSLTQTFSISEPSALSATTTQTDLLCNGSATGAAAVNVTGGTGAYTYAWSPAGGTNASASALAAGTYSCLITDANGCSLTQTFNITEPAPFVPSSIETDVTCFGGSDGAIDITVTGGTLPYTYDWNSGTYTTEDLSGLTAGTYSIVLTDANGCTLTGTMAVVQPSAIAHNGVVTNATGCTTNDGSIDLTTLGGTAPYTFAWSNSATSEDLSGLDGGVYSVIITDSNNCTTSASFTITEPGAPVVTYSEPVDTACQTTTAPFTLSGETPAGGTWSGPGVTGNTFDPMTANLGMNTVIYTYADSAGCSSSATDSIYVDICLDVVNLTSAGFELYPNPTTGVVTIATEETGADISVFDAYGQLVLHGKQTAQFTEINLGELGNGVYFVRVSNGNTSHTQRVIISR